jgi:hypothetical protein
MNTPATDVIVQEAPTQDVLFTVTEESADDPESNRTWTGISAAGIRAEWPLFSALFPDGCDNSLTFTAELNRWHISPEYDS